jgi:hypothetical protein
MAYMESQGHQTHFIYVGCATRNETRISRINTNFIGVFDGLGSGDAQRTGLDRMNRIDRILSERISREGREGCEGADRNVRGSKVNWWLVH